MPHEKERLGVPAPPSPLTRIRQSTPLTAECGAFAEFYLPASKFCPSRTFPERFFVCRRAPSAILPMKGRDETMKQPFVVKALYVAVPVAVMSAVLALFRYIAVLIGM